MLEMDFNQPNPPLHMYMFDNMYMGIMDKLEAGQSNSPAEFVPGYNT